MTPLSNVQFLLIPDTAHLWFCCSTKLNCLLLCESLVLEHRELLAPTLMLQFASSHVEYDTNFLPCPARHISHIIALQLVRIPDHSTDASSTNSSASRLNRSAIAGGHENGVMVLGDSNDISELQLYFSAGAGATLNPRNKR